MSRPTKVPKTGPDCSAGMETYSCDVYLFKK